MSARPGEPPEPPSSRLLFDILEAIADVRDETVITLPPIGEVLDPDALERLLESTTVPTSVVLEVYGCRVEIDGDGDVAATDLDG